ncbi:MAG: HAD family hydrolase [Ignavibacterium sp.]
MKLFAFDFDKTITFSDTILPISKHLCKHYKSNYKFLLIQLSYLLFRMNIISSKSFKENIIKILLKGKNVTEVESQVENFFVRYQSELFNPDIMKIIAEEKKLGNKVIIISSNLNLFINPVKNFLAVDAVFSTKVKVVDNIIQDSIESENCSGAEKAKILKGYVSQFLFDEIISFGDSYGDFEMLKVSDKSYIADYRFNSLIDKILCKLNYLTGKTCSKGFEVNFIEFHAEKSSH